MTKHTAHIERWAEFMKTHPYEEWKKIHTEFIDSQYAMHEKIVEKLRETEEGREKLKKLWRK